MKPSGLFRKYFSQKHLRNTFNQYFNHNIATGIDRVNYSTFLSSLSEEIKLINSKINEGNYNFTNYKEKLIVKSRNSPPRLISIPTIRDKLVLKTLHIILKNTFSEIRQPLPQECIGSIKQDIDKYDTYIKIDISNFYGNIHHGILLDKISNKIKKPEIIDLLHKAITTPTVKVGHRTNEVNMDGIPQGLSISNILAHIYLLEFDEKYYSSSELSYFRYVDDILILCNQKDAKNIKKQILYDLQALLGLPINEDKTEFNLIENGLEYLGYKATPIHGELGLSVKDSNKLKFENSIVNIFTKFKHNKDKSPEEFVYTLNNKITGSITSELDGDKSKQYYYGWLFYFSKIDDIGFLYHLDNLVEKIFHKTSRCNSEVNINDIKKFHKAFFEIKYNIYKTNYIHRPDELSIEQQKQLLVDIFKIGVEQLSSEKKIDKYYRKLVYRPIKDFEKDVMNDIY